MEMAAGRGNSGESLMPIKRRASKHRPHLTPELRPKAERLLELQEEHVAAIQTGDDAVYEAGGLEAIHALGPEVHAALGIRPWEDGEAIIQAALEEAERE